MNEKKAIFLKDYQKPDFMISSIFLDFTILEAKILVKSTLVCKKINSNFQELILNGENLITKKIAINGKDLSENEYSITDNILKIFNTSDNFTLETEVEIDPFNNTYLMGIYKSNSCICSQCEPEGFRRITWFIDRPDVMPLWKVKITGSKIDYPIILSNGNLIEKFEDGDNHSLLFEDPNPKPSYLFAFVAGDFDFQNSIFTTKQGKNVTLNVFVEKGKKDQALFALKSLKNAMKWDEDKFNLVYELDVFSIVAVSDFNFGAMENTSLNIFNDAYVLANSEIATDSDYFNIESVVAHEYFHNFTGNKITCRDWFQLTLKEGLTVYRDHIFSQDLRNKDIVRIQEVETLRNVQFMEDNGALSHPIRPQSYIEMNNFYTSTVYEKGSEVIRMISTIIGEENFKKGMSTYFLDFSGQAVTCEDFIASMEKASGVSLEKFKKWYFQSGTPIVKVNTEFDSSSFTFKVKLEQINNPTTDQKIKDNLVIPLKFALFNQKGKQLNLQIKGNGLGQEGLLILENKFLEITCENITEKPILSINRNFSAPIILDINQSDNDLITLIKHDSDGFNKYEAVQIYLKKYLIDLINNLEQGKEVSIDKVKSCLEFYDKILDDYKNNYHLTSIMLSLPSFNALALEIGKNLPIESIVRAISLFENIIADTFYDKFLTIFNSLTDKEEEFSTEMMAIRSLKNKSLYYLLKSSNNEFLNQILDYYNSVNSMSKKIGILLAIKDLSNTKEHQLIFTDFYEKFKKYPTVLNKWFAINASFNTENVLDHIKSLLTLDTFSLRNPNNVRSLISGFINNQKAFHKLDGSGYKFLAEIIIKLDKINPSIAANLAKSLAKFEILTINHQKLIKEYAKDILNQPHISKGTFEVLSKIIK